MEPNISRFKHIVLYAVIAVLSLMCGILFAFLVQVYAQIHSISKSRDVVDVTLIYQKDVTIVDIDHTTGRVEATLERPLLGARKIVFYISSRSRIVQQNAHLEGNTVTSFTPPLLLTQQEVTAPSHATVKLRVQSDHTFFATVLMVHE